jgi:hypothetical protein
MSSLFKRLAVLALLVSCLQGKVSAQTVFYDNTINYLAQVYRNNNATNVAGNTITNLVADDIQLDPSYAGQTLDAFSFSVANLSTTAVSARARVRFYAADGTNGGPGTYITGYTFNPISFAASSVTIYSTTGVSIAAPLSGKFWAGMTFDNNTGATGATAADLNNLGQGIFDPPTVGSSTDNFFVSTAAGSYVSNNPAGTITNFNGNPVANFGWRFSSTAVPAPGAFGVFLMGCTGGVGLLRRQSRRKKIG